MALEIQDNNLQPESFSEDTQAKIANTVVENWSNGRKDRAEREKVWERCWKAFSQYVDPEFYPEHERWRSNHSLPWSYQAAIAGTTQIRSITMPNDENFFQIRPVNGSDELQVLNAEALTKYQKRIFKKGNFANSTDLFLLQGSVIGCTCMKVYWKQRQGKIDMETEGLVYDAPWYEFVKMQDFVIYPANNADVSESMMIQRLFRNISDIKANDESNGGVYINTDSITSNDAVSNPNDDSFSKNIACFLGVKDPTPPKNQAELLEAWGDFVIDGKTYRDFVCVVANRKHVIRFEPNPYPQRPFLFTSFREIPGSAYGEGFIEKGLPIQDRAEFISNFLSDELTIKLFKQYGYKATDRTFDPDNFIQRPGGLHAMDGPDSIWTIDNSSNISTPLEMLNVLKAEYEETTTVLKYAKGGDSSSGSGTATSDTILSQASDKNFTNIAKHLNEKFLEPAVAFTYELIRMFGSKEDIATYTGCDPEILMEGVPLSDLAIDITGLQTVTDNNERIQSIEKLYATLAQLPQGGMVNWESITEDWMKLHGFDDKERYMMGDEVCKQVQQSIITQSLQALIASQQMMQQQAMAQSAAMQGPPTLPQGNANSLEAPQLAQPSSPGATPQ